MDKLNLENIKSIIKASGFELPESDAIIYLIAEEVLYFLREACVREDFPDEAYKHIELMIAYKTILDIIEQLNLQEILENPGALNQAKAISIENTRVEFNTDSKASKGKYDEIQRSIKDKYNLRYKTFIHRYRKLVAYGFN